MIEPPIIDSFSPTFAKVNQRVVITGAYFDNASAVTFNGVPASYTVDSGTRITAFVPATATTGFIRVTTQYGTGISATAFTVLRDPIVSSFSPVRGPQGSVVTIVGDFFTDVVTVTFNGEHANYTVISVNEIRATVPSTALTGPIAVTTFVGTGVSGTNFQVVPTLEAPNPTGGNIGMTVYLTGTALNDVTDVSFNGIPAQFSGVTMTNINAIVPNNATTGYITVTTPGGTATTPSPFTVGIIPGPTAGRLYPPDGEPGTEIDIEGNDLSTTTGVNFNNVPASSVTVVSPTHVRVIVPGGASTGPIEVVQTGGSFQGPIFTVRPPAPTIISLAPASGAVGSTVVVNGTDFTGTTAVRFNRALASSVTVNSPTRLTAVVPAGATTGPVAVTTPSGTVRSSTSFTLVPPSLTVSGAVTLAPGAYRAITVAAGGTVTLAGDITVDGDVVVEPGGGWADQCYRLLGTGTFTLMPGATLRVCDAQGLGATGNTGSIQVSGARAFSPDASYVYTGTAPQVSGAGLPAQLRSLTVAGTAPLTLSQPTTVGQTLTMAGRGNLLLNGQALTLQSSAAGTALVVNSGTGTVQGATAAVQCYLDPSANSGLGYRQFSPPVSGSAVADLATAAFMPNVSRGAAYNTSPTPALITPFPNVFGYDQSRVATAVNNLSAFDKGYVAPTALTDPLVVGRGYTVNLAPAQVVDFVGTLTTGTQTVALSRNASASANATSAGWHLLGNPYPSPLDYSLIAPADRPNLDASLYVFESSGPYAGAYRSYINGIGNPLIGSSQAFFARVSAGQTTGSLTFRDAQRVTSYGVQVPVRRDAADVRPLVELRLQAPDGSADALFAYAENGATAGLDPQYDAEKLLNSTRLNLAAVSGTSEWLAIDARPAFASGTVISLVVGVPAAGTYTLAAPAFHNLASLVPLLTDAATGRTISLQQQRAYAFTVNAAQAATALTGRFTLHFAAAAPLAAAPPLSAAQVAVYPNPAPGRFTVLLPGTGTAAPLQMELLNALGQAVWQQVRSLPSTGASLDVDASGLSAGVYSLRLRGANAACTKRVVLQ